MNCEKDESTLSLNKSFFKCYLHLFFLFLVIISFFSFPLLEAIETWVILYNWRGRVVFIFNGFFLNVLK